MLRSTSRLSSLLQHLRPTHAAMFSTQPPSLAALDLNELPRYPLSPVPTPKDKDAFVQTAACLIIGDEVLNGKTKDTNSNFMAKLLFDVGVDLKRIEVIADDEDEIVEAVRRLHKGYGLVITSGGVGPTHDDITYQSIAKAFDAELEYNQETIDRMEASGKKRYNMGAQTEEQKTARLRMALFPVGAEVLHVREDL